MKAEDTKVCALCGGQKEQGKTTFTTDLGFGIVVVRDVVADVCSQCGSDWISDSVAQKLEHIVANARKNHKQVEIVSLSA